jgi:hypothetical protein
MTYQPIGPRRPVELLLSEDLVREVEETMGDVSEVVERSLRSLIDRRRSQPSANDRAYYDEMIAIGHEFYEKHGVWGDEFSTL